MTTIASAKNQDPTLYCAYFGGPRDGLKTGDLPASLSGMSLTGMVSKVPLSQPAQFSLFAVHVCTSETQIDGFWRFEFERLEGPNGELLVEVEETCGGMVPPALDEPALDESVVAEGGAA